MARFAYMYSDKAGKTGRAEIEANDELELKAVLVQEGLFLISWRAVDAAPAAPLWPKPPIPLALITDDAKQPPTWYEKGWRFLRTPRGLLLLAGFLAVGVLGDLVYLRYFADANPFFTRSPGGPLDKLHPGCTRSEVERILTQRAAAQPLAGSTVYILDATTSIVVPYDQTGGVLSPRNKMSGPFFSQITAAK